MKFGYEDLKVWNMAVDFAVKVIELVENLKIWKQTGNIIDCLNKLRLLQHPFL